MVHPESANLKEWMTHNKPYMISQKVPNREILASHRTQPQLFQAYPEEAEFLRLTDPMMAQMRKGISIGSPVEELQPKYGIIWNGKGADQAKSLQNLSLEVTADDFWKWLKGNGDLPDVIQDLKLSNSAGTPPDVALDWLSNYMKGVGIPAAAFEDLAQYVFQ